MHPKVLSPETWKIVRGLSKRDLLDGWTLAGGTGLALQMGHRYSEDLDFFRHGDFESDQLLGSLTAVGRVVVHSRSRGTLHVTVNGLRVSFLEAQAALLFPAVPYRGLAVADARDIAVMKVVAIGGRGSRKDFVDLYFYLRLAGGLEPVFQMIQRRFSKLDYNEYHLLKSLVYFEDAEIEPLPQMIRELNWDEVKSFLVDEVRRLSP